MNVVNFGVLKLACGHSDTLTIQWVYYVVAELNVIMHHTTGLSKKMGGIWNRYNLKSTGRIYTFGVLKCSEKFKVLDLP